MSNTPGSIPTARRPLLSLPTKLTILAVCVIFVGVHFGGWWRGIRGKSAHACIHNLVKIQAAKEQWALETHAASDATPTDSDLFGPSRYLRKKPKCPDGGTYIIGRVIDPVRCSLGGEEHSLP